MLMKFIELQNQSELTINNAGKIGAILGAKTEVSFTDLRLIYHTAFSESQRKKFVEYGIYSLSARWFEAEKLANLNPNQLQAIDNLLHPNATITQDKIEKILHSKEIKLSKKQASIMSEKFPEVIKQDLLDKNLKTIHKKALKSSPSPSVKIKK